MKRFTTDKRALDFVAGKIAAEAEREGTPLSEVERKMLYFSETEWTLPEMAEVSAQFDRDYNQSEYEKKIAGLISHVLAGFEESDSAAQDDWDAAIEKLSDGDRYLLVMVEMAGSAGTSKAGHGFLPTPGRPNVRPPHDFLKLIVSATAILVATLGFVLFVRWLHETKRPAAVWILRHEGPITYLLIIVAALVFSFWNYLSCALRAWLDSRRLRVG